MSRIALRDAVQLEGCAAQAAGELKRLTNRTVGISAVASQARLNRQLMVELLYKAAGEHSPALAPLLSFTDRKTLNASTAH